MFLNSASHIFINNQKQLPKNLILYHRKKIQDIMRHTDDELLREILKEADDENNRDAVFSMLELMADDTIFTSSKYHL